MDFGDSGLWIYDGTAWTGIVGWNPEDMILWSSKLAADFGDNGLWVYNGVSWSHIAPLNPDKMVADGSKLLGNFGGYGLWQYDGIKWTGLARKISYPGATVWLRISEQTVFTFLTAHHGKVWLAGILTEWSHGRKN
ncbi:MAG: hypothetical protein BWK80_13600 [Desulfobacteraceae bacterium IS3]|nr:MAG: hypothetical protein BWK80_13600 [Desulfobacteraceae bacterium IS3]